MVRLPCGWMDFKGSLDLIFRLFTSSSVLIKYLWFKMLSNKRYLILNLYNVNFKVPDIRKEYCWGIFRN